MAAFQTFLSELVHQYLTVCMPWMCQWRIYMAKFWIHPLFGLMFFIIMQIIGWRSPLRLMPPPSVILDPPLHAIAKALKTGLPPRPCKSHKKDER